MGDNSLYQRLHTYLICTRRDIFYVPDELQYLIMVMVEVKPPTDVSHLSLLSNVTDDQCYKFDSPQYFLSDHLPNPNLCVDREAVKCLQHYLNMGGELCSGLYEQAIRSLAMVD